MCSFQVTSKVYTVFKNFQILGEDVLLIHTHRRMMLQSRKSADSGYRIRFDSWLYHITAAWIWWITYFLNPNFLLKKKNEHHNTHYVRGELKKFLTYYHSVGHIVSALVIIIIYCITIIIIYAVSLAMFLCQTEVSSHYLSLAPSHSFLPFLPN